MVMPISTGQAAQVGATTQELNQRQQVDRVIRQIVPSDAAVNQAPTAEELVEPVQRINEALRPYALEFDLGNDHAKVVARIVDLETGDLIRQIPSEEVLRISERLSEIQGLLIERQV